MSATPGRPRVPPWVTATLVVVLLGSAGVALDRSYRADALARGRMAVAQRLQTQARALSIALAQRITLVEGLRAWLATTSGQSLQGFDVVARTLYGTAPGIRALQVLEDGVIVRSYAPADDPSMLGADLREHPDARVVANLERAERSDSLVTTPTPELLQGGPGVVMRRRAAPREGHVRLATAVLDLEPLLDGAGLGPDAPAGFVFRLRDAAGRVIAGADSFPGRESVAADIPVAGESWHLSTPAPVSAGLEGQGALHLAEGAGILALILIGFTVFQRADRRRQLEEAVTMRTEQLARANDDLQEALASLRAQDDRLAMALKAGGVTTWEWSLVHDTIRHFPGSMDGLEGDSATGEVSFEAVAGRVHPEDRSRFREAEQRTRASGADFDVEYRVQLPDGSIHWRHDAGRVDAERQSVHGAVADITRAKELEEQLDHARRLEAAGQLAGGIAHDFNNLMQVILGETTLLRLDHPEAELQEGLNEISQAAERASRLTAQLLAFSRRRPVRPEPLDLEVEVGVASAMLSRLLGANIHLVQEAGDRPVIVLVDPSQLTQILVNLAVNARDAMPEGGKLTLRTGVRELTEGLDGVLEPGSFGVLEVEDEGEGIVPEALPRIFDPFYTTKAPGKGTGLGLASVYGAVRQAGGHVTVRSEPGVGTTFTVYLPRAARGVTVPDADG